MDNWRLEHKKIIDAFLEYLNQKSTEYILKGGTALMECYNLDRFSEDIALDGKGNRILSIVQNFCKQNGYNYRVAKNTDTVKRYMVHYNKEKALKIEMSARRKRILDNEVNIINGIQVYKIDVLASMKCNAYMSRDNIRDLYDIAFICNNYDSELSNTTILAMQDALSYKGLEYFDYIISNQKNPLINTNQLAESFLKMYDKLNLLIDKNEEKEFKDEFCNTEAGI